MYLYIVYLSVYVSTITKNILHSEDPKQVFFLDWAREAEKGFMGMGF